MEGPYCYSKVLDFYEVITRKSSITAGLVLVSIRFIYIYIYIYVCVCAYTRYGEQ